MAKPPPRTVPSIPLQFNRLFPAEWLRRTAREAGAMIRFRSVDIVPLFWTLLMGPAGGQYRTLAALQRLFLLMGGCKLVTSAFLNRFNAGLLRFLSSCVQRAFEFPLSPWGIPKLYRRFRDVLAVDSTLVTVADALSGVFPGSRKNTHPAAIKVNAVYSVLSGSLKKLTIAPGIRGEPRLLKLGRSIRDQLLLFDLGYFSYGIFERIDRYRGYFISRMKANANPVIVKDRRTGSGRYRSLVGRKLGDVLKGLKRECLDVDVEVRAQRRRYRGRTGSTNRVVLRVVGVLNPDTSEHHVYITNVNAEQMTPEQIAVAYSNRWVVELLFRELKHCYGLKDFPSENPTIVKALIYAALLRVVLSRTALDNLRRRLYGGHHGRKTPLAEAVEKVVVRQTPMLRAAEVFSLFAPFLLTETLRRAGAPPTTEHLEDLMLLCLLDPNKSRRLLYDRVCDA